jgi:acetoin utilization deacetylase AcuC-like enzyme
VSGLIGHLSRIQPRDATDEEILRVHTSDYLERIKRESQLPKGGDAGDGISPFGKGAFEIARRGAGSALAMTEAVVAGTVDNGYALVNPAGHHAIPDTGMGFCIFNNVAIAAKHAREALGVGKVAIVDWDVHHGNGAQAIFAEDPEVLTISLHQDRCFPPNSGLVEDRGSGAGRGYNLNIPMPTGTGDDGYKYAAAHVIGPALDAFAPELIIVASGFDANAMDPLARQLITSRGFIALTETVMAASTSTTEGRLVLVQEGGYSPVYVPFCGLATIETLAGVHVLDDAILPVVGGMGGHQLEAHEKALVDRVAEFVTDL